MLMPGRNGQRDEYRYGFQGQETDDEVYGKGSAVSYKYRVHDARIGRFLSIDPLAPDYPHNSPYAFSENRVIDGVELEGLEVHVLNDESEIHGPFTPEYIDEKNKSIEFENYSPSIQRNAPNISHFPSAVPKSTEAAKFNTNISYQNGPSPIKEIPKISLTAPNPVILALALVAKPYQTGRPDFSSKLEGFFLLIILPSVPQDI
ncbi:hypothetical protein [Pontibacter sp. G13]|uniref:RHS repeat domain-containing protein n=1 Tax=Pontibacter sp. G13 TaxID=3074898 RepID=UPI00288989B2|nr:hypothetical protein [Pontibacter sp. G13]WNJ21515.1 hypothetical protein RJD25_03945 [Pontibacter sp. G13]